MKTLFTAIYILVAYSVSAQQDTAAHTTVPQHAAYTRYSIIPTVAIGFIDGYRNSYSLPSGYLKNNTSGFAPVFLKLEYGLGRNISLAATFGYDAFVYNFSQNYTGNTGPFVRYRTDAFKLYSGGITAYYHLGNIIPVKHLDPFIGVGLAIDNIRYSAYPAGDSSAPLKDHKAGLYAKAGARYYISDKFSVFGDAGYEKESIISIGFSCRFFPKRKGM